MATLGIWWKGLSKTKKVLIISGTVFLLLVGAALDSEEDAVTGSVVKAVDKVSPSVVGSEPQAEDKVVEPVEEEPISSSPVDRHLIAEIRPYVRAIGAFTVINRNSFDWHNLRLSVDDYYFCTLDVTNLESDDMLLVQYGECSDGHGRGFWDSAVDMGKKPETVTIIADEGSAIYEYVK